MATVIVADATLARAIALHPDDRRRLRSGRAVSLDAGLPRSLTLETATGRATLSPTSATHVAYWPYLLGPRPVLVDPAHARRIGLPTRVVGAVGIAPHGFSDDERSQLQPSRIDVYWPNAGASSASAQSFVLQVGEPSDNRTGFRSPTTVRRWSIAATIALALLISVIALLLGASESRDEKAALDMIGARPVTARLISTTNNWVLSVIGALIAIPVGFIPIAVVFISVQKHDVLSTSVSGRLTTSGDFPEIVFPWITVIGIVVVIPLVAALGAWVASAIAQRAHAFRGTLAFDAD